MRVGLLGDVMLGRGVAERLVADQRIELWSPEVIDLAASLDLVVCNLECCVSERGRPTTLFGRGEHPFLFRAPPHAVAQLQTIGVRAVGLANNHALDFGPEALVDTLEHLERAEIAVSGAGKDDTRARAGVVAEAGGKRLGMVAVADHPREFAAEDDKPGIAYADLADSVPAWLLGELRRLGGECDAVLAFPHWGPNMATRPKGWQHHVATALLRAGADLVAGHSAHVFHGVDWSTVGPIAYDLGDALDDYAVDPVHRNDLGMLAIWTVGGGEAADIELVGLALDYCRTGLARGADADWIADRLTAACAEFGTRVERTGEQRFRVLRPG